MRKPLRLLLVEDSPDDAQLLLLELQHGEYDVEYTRVESRASFQKALESGSWNMIICDYSLPQFNALKALDVLHESGLDLPFIIISGSISEEAAITALKAGAHDFLTKENLARLLPAIEREMREADVRRQRREGEEKYRTLVEQLPMIIYMNPVSEIGHTTFISPQVKGILGYTPEEWLQDPKFWQALVHEEDRAAVLSEVERVAVSGEPFNMEYRMIARDGRIVWFHDEAILIRDPQGQPLFWQGFMVDVSEQKRAAAAVHESERRFRTVFENSPVAIWEEDFSAVRAHLDELKRSGIPDLKAYLAARPEEVLRCKNLLKVIDVNEAALRLQNARDKADLTERGQMLLTSKGTHTFMQELVAIANGVGQFGLDTSIFTLDGEEREVSLRWVTAPGHELTYSRVLISVVDITERTQAEQALRRQDEELRQRNLELARLYRASESLHTATEVDLPGLSAKIVQSVLREFEHSNCSLLLLNRETKELERLAVEGPYASDVKSARLTLEGAGLAPKCVRTGAILNVPDVSADPDYIANWKQARSELVIPLKAANDVIGALDVQSAEPSAFDADDERVMGVFAERAALAIERTRLHEQTLRQLDRLDSLRKIDLAISSAFDLRLLLNVVLEQVQTQLRVDAADVLILDPGMLRLEYASGRGFRTHAIESTGVKLGEGLAGRCAFEKRIVHSTNLAEHEGEFARRDLLREESFVSYFGVPLIAKGDVKGVLEIFSRTPIQATMEWLDFLDALGWQTAIALDNANLFDKIQRSNTALQLAYDATIEGWSRAMDMRDKETEGHTLRVTELTLQLARAMGFKDEQLVHIRRGALLHDIGKLGVPDAILLKPGKLNDVEWEVMRQHPQRAYEWLAPIAYLQPSLEIPYCHHEKWDGTGYPRGLKGDLIPLSARIFAVVDVWDALTNDRPYRPAWSEKETIKYIRENSGKHFDPQVVDLFLKNLPRPPKGR